MRNTAAVHLLSIHVEHQTNSPQGFSRGDRSVHTPAHSEPCAHPHVPHELYACFIPRQLGPCPNLLFSSAP